MAINQRPNCGTDPQIPITTQCRDDDFVTPAYTSNFNNFRYLLLFLTLVIAAMLLVDWPALFGLSSNDGRTPCQSRVTDKKDKITVEEREFLIKQYENAVKEIQYRIQQESLLFAMKFSLVGAILALMFTSALKVFKNHRCLQLGESTDIPFNPPMIAMFCWAATITSAIVDTRIMYHSDVIVTLGSWIKAHVEPMIYSDSTVMGWEGFFGDSRLLHSRLYPLLRLNTNLLTFFLFSVNCIAFSFYRLGFCSPTKELRTVCAAGTICCFFVFMLVSFHFQFDQYINLFNFKIPWSLICLSLSILGVVIACFYWLLRYPEELTKKEMEEGK